MAEFWILATSFSIVCIIRAAAWLQEACRILRSRGCSCNVEELRSYYQERVDALLANEANTSYCNYLSFMRICRFDFAVMSFVSMVIISVGWSPQEAFEQATCAIISGTDDLAYILPRCRLMLKLDQLRLVCIYLMVTSFGFLVLVSAQALGTSQEKTTAPDRDAAERIDRTLWIKGLPVRDHRRHRRFLLSDEDFERVTGDLRSAIEDHLAVVEQGALRHTRRSSFWTSQDKNAIETLLVVPVVDQWHNVSMTLRATEERAVSYERWSSGTTHNQVLTWWYRRKHIQCLRKSEGLRRDLLRITLEKKQLSGSAFVTFRTMESRDIILLNELPYRCNKKCLKKGHSLFTFGRPPFSSVTLKTEPAPHPADINWENLHVAFWVRKFRYFFSTGLLIVCMVLVVHPETFKYPPGKGVNRTTANIAAYMEVFLPTVILVVNGLVLPECIYRIALFERSTRKSVSELRQLIQNFFFFAQHVPASVAAHSNQASHRRYNCGLCQTKSRSPSRVLRQVPGENNQPRAGPSVAIPCELRISVERDHAHRKLVDTDFPGVRHSVLLCHYARKVAGSTALPVCLGLLVRFPPQHFRVCTRLVPVHPWNAADHNLVFCHQIPGR